MDIVNEQGIKIVLNCRIQWQTPYPEERHEGPFGYEHLFPLLLFLVKDCSFTDSPRVLYVDSWLEAYPRLGRAYKSCFLAAHLWLVCNKWFSQTVWSTAFKLPLWM